MEINELDDTPNISVFLNSFSLMNNPFFQAGLKFSEAYPCVCYDIFT